MSTNPRAGAPVNVVNGATEEQEILHVKPVISGEISEFLTDLKTEGIDMLTKKQVIITTEKSQQPTLGPLVNLQGDWTGRGLNVMSLPNNFKANPDQPFRVKINALIEDTEFSPISAPIPNRGNTQKDIFFLGHTYLQKVSDEETLEGIHIEPGIFLFLPANDVQTDKSVVRMATIPHGDSVMAQGGTFDFPGAPAFALADPTPFELIDGKRVNIDSKEYLAALTGATAPDRYTQAELLNPNLVLQHFNDKLKDNNQKIVNTTVFQVNASPIGGIDIAPGFTPNPAFNETGIKNIPFVVKNADANSMTAIFWINTVENEDKTQFLVLQYSQTVILKFPIPVDPTKPDGPMRMIMWPHITVANLIKR